MAGVGTEVEEAAVPGRMRLRMVQSCGRRKTGEMVRTLLSEQGCDGGLGDLQREP